MRVCEELNKEGNNDTSKIIIMPQYILNERLKVYKEVKAPPEELFIGLGWDENKETKRKHYR
jgi:hypothetical protein